MADRGRFDPTPYLRQLRGRGGGSQDYLDVKWRLLWLRREHPDATILTEHVRIDEGQAVFKATVSVPSGGRATGYGSETKGDFGDFIEKAETKAIGRALNALGYGAQFLDFDDAGPASAPRERSDWFAAIAGAESLEDLDKVGRDMTAAGLSGDDLRDAYAARKADLKQAEG